MSYIPDVGVSRDEAVAAGRNSMDFFAAMAVPEVYEFGYPPILHAVWQMIGEAAQKPLGKDRLALGIPRGFSKTLMMKLFVAWSIAYTNRKFILVVCNTATLAENFIADVADILSNINFVRIYGDWRLSLEKDTQELKKFTFRGRNITLAGLGSGSSLRGLNIRYVRPDLILMDDMQSREQAASQVEADKIFVWMLGTLMKAADPRRCLFTFIGNMYPFEGSILRKLQANPAWVSFVTGAILEDGESLWPELRPVDDILAELENDESLGHPEIFYSEVMNDAVTGSKAGIDFSKINIWDNSKPPDSGAQAGFVILDPSLAKKKSDDTAIGACLIYDGEPVLRELKTGKFNELAKIDTMIRMAAKYGLRALIIEAVAYQESLVFWAEMRKQQLGLTDLLILTISPKSMAKNSRILAGLKHLVADKERIFLHPTVKSQVTHQITYFDPTKLTNKDDILDIIAYFYPVIHEHRYKLLRPFETIGEPVEAAFSDDLVLGF